LHGRFVIRQSNISINVSYYSLNDVAILCIQCNQSINDGILPIYSIVNKPLGWNAQDFLPKLSTFGKLVIQKSRLFRHIFKITDGKSSLAVSGHVTAIDIGPMNIDSIRYLPYVNDEYISILFIGTKERYTHLVQVQADNTIQLLQAYNHIFDVSFKDLIIILKFKKASDPAYYDININDSEQNQGMIEGFPIKSLNNAHVSNII
jgi:hypothetical protein